MKTKPTALKRRLIPDNVFELHKAVAHARERAVVAIDRLGAAQEAHAEARRVADQAPRRDGEAKYMAISEGKRPPKATAPTAEEAAEDARIMVAVAGERVEAAFRELEGRGFESRPRY